MRKVLLFLFIFLSIVAAAQTTNVTATVQYPDGSVFANGTVLATFTPPTGVIDQNLYLINGSTFPYIVSGVMNSGGTFTMTLTDDQKARPQGGRWNFTLCSFASTSCNNVLLDVSGASVNLSSAINAAISNILGEPTNIRKFYADSEVTTNGIGGIIYYNLTSNVYRCYNGTTWSNCNGTGSTGTVTQVNTTSPITGGPFTTTGTIACATCAVTGSTLAQFASTTSAQLATLLSDEIGSGSAVFAASLVGTDTGLLTAGVVSGTSVLLCTDANGGATTSSCPSASTSFPLTVSGTVNSGGIPYFSNTTTESSSGALTQFGVLFGGGAGGAPTSSAQGAANMPLLGNGAANPIFSTIGYPTTATSGGVLYMSSATQISSSGVIGGAANKIIKSASAGNPPAASTMTDNGVAVTTAIPFIGGNTVRLTANSSAITATTPGTVVLTFGALPGNTNLSFHCGILYNQQTAAVAGTGFAIQSATNAPTRLDVVGNMFTSNAGVSVQGTVQNLTTTTATSIISGTPSAITTVFPVYIDGTIQMAASAGTLQLLAFTGNASDSITVQAGSFCSISP